MELWPLPVSPRCAPGPSPLIISTSTLWSTPHVMMPLLLLGALTRRSSPRTCSPNLCLWTPLGSTGSGYWVGSFASWRQCLFLLGFGLVIGWIWWVLGSCHCHHPVLVADVGQLSLPPSCFSHLSGCWASIVVTILAFWIMIGICSHGWLFFLFWKWLL